ncbi:hypothetical protein [Rufibacter soli]
MKTFISDLIPKLKRYSHNLDNLTLLTDKHWVIIDEIDLAKNVYIFRKNGQLIISQNGKVEKATWEYLGNNSILIDRDQDSYLFRHGFFDENVLALKVDGKEEYAFMINENSYEGEINSFEKITNFLKLKYLDSNTGSFIINSINLELNNHNKIAPKVKVEKYTTSKGIIEIETEGIYNTVSIGNPVYTNKNPTPNGKYKIGFLFYIHIKDGLISDITLF